MISLLFVDDESNVLSGLRRLLRKKSKVWDMTFVLSGMEALQFLETQCVDIIISDMKMPNMTGAELLSKVKNSYPNITRLCLSGQSESKQVLENRKIIQLYIAKPTDSDTLINIIERCILLRSIINDKSLIDIKPNINYLLSLPPIYEAILDELSVDNVNINNIGNILSSDSQMMEKILKAINSEYFNLPSELTTPLDVIESLGVNVVKSLVLSIKFFEQFQDTISTEILDDVWVRSVRAGILARKIAHSENLNEEESDALLISGMLQSIGALTLLKQFSNDLDDSYFHALRTHTEKFREKMEESFGVSPEKLSAYILDYWDVPIPIVESVAYHYKNDLENKRLAPIILSYSRIIIDDISQAEFFINSGLITVEQHEAWVKYI